ncbi:MAG TPA: ABC transporter transmembrane domain-containing protein [Geminicoccus sp.]|uniref:ABC transporter transmembrane domain-containing protein n=1 Tax=Geminicoccus sp. TaxID=2024832 RepID=UPI002BB61846|nr:ABC transporter transmembrane domain-containing protein [Geminicoccus sp.]HWL69835.1 ABC transporter transmembrane domain-containing protein [Geminicoccus sp.]
MKGGQRRSGRVDSGRAGTRDLGQLRRLATYLRPHRPLVIGTLVALTVAALAVLSIGAGLRHIVDGGFVQGRPRALDHALEAVGLVILVLALATFFRSYLVTRLGERLVADLRKDVFARVIRLSPAFFERARTGEVISRITTDTAVIQTLIGASVTQALRNLLLLVGGLAILLVTSPRLTGFVLLVVPLVVVPIVLIGRRVRVLSRALQDQVAELGVRVEETLNGVRTVQGFGQEERETERFSASAEATYGMAVRYARARSTLSAVVIALVFGAIGVVLWLGGYDVLEGRITPGELSAFVFYAALVASAVGGLADVMGDLQRAAGATERLFELLDTQPAVTAPASPRPIAATGGAVRFERVGFAYPSFPDRPVLREFDLDVAPGERVALVGPSGAGKSSVLQLLLRFYEPDAGQILVDGVPLAELDPVAHRRRLGWVPQEPMIFSGTALDNIRYGRPEAGLAEVRAAAEAAAALGFIEALPQGFDTHLGEKGVRLSGGQRQRIAIARALLADPRILLLDEATSALDAENERLVQQALERLMQGRTTLVIAHRLATVLAADRIVVMDGGRIVETGRHQDLVANDGLYGRLAALQFTDAGAAMRVA